MSLTDSLKRVIELLTHLSKWSGKEDELSRLITSGPSGEQMPKPTAVVSEAPPPPESAAEATTNASGESPAAAEVSHGRGQQPEPKPVVAGTIEHEVEAGGEEAPPNTERSRASTAEDAETSEGSAMREENPKSNADVEPAVKSGTQSEVPVSHAS
jgi:hypothetical protein